MGFKNVDRLQLHPTNIVLTFVMRIAIGFHKTTGERNRPVVQSPRGFVHLAKKTIIEMKTEYLKKIFFNCSLSALIINIPATASGTGRGEGVAYEASGVATVEFRHEAAQDRRETTVPGCVVCHLGAAERLILSFDVIGGNTESLYYSFAHCNADWQPSDLMEMEYMDGFNRIYDEEECSMSFNTTTAYAHYELTISTAPLMASGNYMIEVRRTRDDAMLVRVPMWMSEELCGVASRVERKESTQDVELAVIWPDHGISSPETQMTVAVWQNKRIDDLRKADGPTFVRRDEIVYQSQSEFSFCGGTEWRWLDTRSIRLPGISGSRVEYVTPMYHYTMATDNTPRAYTYREDFNGGSWVETRDRRDGAAEVVADYGMAHYTFAPEDPALLGNGEVYVLGDATGWEPSAGNRLTPDPRSMTFTGQHLVKQGLHNYLYASRKIGETRAPQTEVTEGCYGDTENDYYIAVYARRPGETYDHLVAMRRHNTLKTRNDFVM